MPLLATLRSAGSGYQALEAALTGLANSTRQAGQEMRGVGAQSEVEQDIELRQVTRVGAAAGLVGTQNATEQEIQRRVFERVAAEAGLVGVESAQLAEIYRRMVTVVIQPGGLVRLPSILVGPRAL